MADTKPKQHPQGNVAKPANPSLKELLEGHVTEREMAIVSLSAESESGKGVGAVSSGVGDPGGVSYGLYQFTSANGGTVANFLSSKEGAAWKDHFQGMTPGSEKFSDVWRDIAKNDAGAFAAAQTKYAIKTYYDPVAKDLAKHGFDLNEHSDVAKQVVFSTSIQHGVGGGGSILKDSVKETEKSEGKELGIKDDEVFIQHVYANRFAKDAKGDFVHFRAASKDPHQKKGLQNRSVNEPAKAVKRYKAEMGSKRLAQPAGGVKKPTTPEPHRGVKPDPQKANATSLDSKDPFAAPVDVANGAEEAVQNSLDPASDQEIEQPLTHPVQGEEDDLTNTLS